MLPLRARRHAATPREALQSAPKNGDLTLIWLMTDAGLSQYPLARRADEGSPLCQGQILDLIDAVSELAAYVGLACR